MLGLPKGFDPGILAVGKSYSVTKDRERAFPLHLAMLIIDADWNFYGYAVINTSFCKDQKTTLEFTVLNLFSPAEQQFYKRNFLTAAKITGEVK
jgi:hypothetical protein